MVTKGKGGPPIALLALEGVKGLADLGPWVVEDARSNRGTPISREVCYAVRHGKTGVTRVVCPECGQTYGTTMATFLHRRDYHGLKVGANGARDRRRKAPTKDVARPEPRAVEVAAEPGPQRHHQMTIDEAGLDLAAPAILEGMAAIITSRANARAENKVMRSKLERIIAILSED